MTVPYFFAQPVVDSDEPSTCEARDLVVRLRQAMRLNIAHFFRDRMQTFALSATRLSGDLSVTSLRPRQKGAPDLDRDRFLLQPMDWIFQRIAFESNKFHP
jgi:hypothetical protein